MNWSAVVVGFQKLDWIETSMLAKPLSLVEVNQAIKA